VNKQPILGDVVFNSTVSNGPDLRLSSPGSREPVQAPAAPTIQPLATLAQRTSDGSRITGCLVSAMDIYGESKVPAQEQGVIMELTKTAGMMVEKGESIGKIDDSQPMVALKAAEAEIAAKRLQAESREREKFSMLATEVSKTKLDKLIQANQFAKDSVSQIDIEETRLMVEKSKVEVKLAIEEMKVAEFGVASKMAEAEAQQQAIKRRQLLSPISGVIKEIIPHVGEWVKGGDVVFHVINMDRLQVSGTYDLLNDQKIGRPELMNREVEFEFEYKKGEIRKVPAKIVFVDPSNEYASSLVKIKAEIINKYDPATKDWLVHPNNIGDLILFSKR
jgi:multidrug efflux pump subunit AcrA (membrane-fusion protein)